MPKSWTKPQNYRSPKKQAIYLWDNIHLRRTSSEIKKYFIYLCIPCHYRRSLHLKRKRRQVESLPARIFFTLARKSQFISGVRGPSVIKRLTGEREKERGVSSVAVADFKCKPQRRAAAVTWYLEPALSALRAARARRASGLSRFSTVRYGLIWSSLVWSGWWMTSARDATPTHHTHA